MSVITLPWSMEQDRIDQIKANSTHVDDNFNTLLNAVNGKLDLDGPSTPTANISWNNNKITNLASPTANGDAATKGYVDSAIINNAKVATASVLGQVKIGDNVDVELDGTISVADASTSAKGVLQLGKSDTMANAAVEAVRSCVLTNTLPGTLTDGVIYFLYEL